MNRDYKLLDEALRTLVNIRPWVSADYYKTNISQVVYKLRERLASIDAEQFVLSRHKREDAGDTVPSKLDEMISSFGIFNEAKNEKPP